MFVVINSVPGGGKRQQYKKIASKLRQEGHKVIDQDFPDRAGVLFENLIYPSIHEDVSNTPKQRFLAFLLDQMAHTARIEKHRKKGYVITEGYFTSTLAYQVLFEKALSLDQALQIAKMMELPVPDFAIYIDTPAQKAHKRRVVEEGFGDKRDYWGKDVQRVEKLNESFRKLVKDEVFCPWEVVDGSKDDVGVTGKILDVIKKRSK